jgi:hypothetical protein
MEQPQRVAVTAYLKRELVLQLQQASEQEDLSLSRVVERAVRQALKPIVLPKEGSGQ